jgi:hypothetical protein
VECATHKSVVTPTDAEWHERAPTPMEICTIVKLANEQDEGVLTVLCACVDPEKVTAALPTGLAAQVTFDVADEETVVLR